MRTKDYIRLGLAMILCAAAGVAIGRAQLKHEAEVKTEARIQRESRYVEKVTDEDRELAREWLRIYFTPDDESIDNLSHIIHRARMQGQWDALKCNGFNPKWERP